MLRSDIHQGGFLSLSEELQAGTQDGSVQNKMLNPLISAETGTETEGDAEEAFSFFRITFSRFIDQLPNPKNEPDRRGVGPKSENTPHFSGHTRLSRLLQKGPDSLSGYLKDPALLTALFKWSSTLHSNPGACGAGLHPGVCTFVGPPQNE